MNTLKILAKPSKFIFYLTLTIFFSKPIHAQNCRMGIAINDKNGGLNTLDIIEVNICKGSVYKFMAQPNHQNFQWYYNGITLKDSTNESISVEKEGEYL